MLALPTQQSPCSASFSRNNTLAWINSLSLSHLPRNHSWVVPGQTWPVSAQSQRIIFCKTKGMTLNHFLPTQEDKPTPRHPIKNLKAQPPQLFRPTAQQPEDQKTGGLLWLLLDYKCLSQHKYHPPHNDILLGLNGQRAGGWPRWERGCCENMRAWIKSPEPTEKARYDETHL